MSSTMNRRGDLIFWEISGFTVDKPTLETTLNSMGIGRLLPRNDFKTAALRAIRTVTKGNDKLYRRFNDHADKVNFGIFTEVTTEDDLNFKREVIISLDKTTGNIEAVNVGDAELWNAFKIEYSNTKKTIDQNQFRSIVLKVVKHECFGVAMRKGGGIYFIDQRFDALREKLSKLFEAFPESMSLHSIPIFENAGTDKALEAAASEDIFSDIETLIQDVEAKFQEGTITRRQLEGRQSEAGEILEKIKVHERHLRSQAFEVKRKLEAVTTALGAVIGKVDAGIFEPEDFYKEIERFEKSKAK